MPLARGLEIVRRRDLHVPGIAVHDVYLIARALGKRGFVGRLDAGASGLHGGGEHVAAESLRRLRQVDGLARNGLDDRRRRATA